MPENHAPANIGVVGLAVMGSNLARNLASREGNTVAVFNRTYARTQELAARIYVELLGSTVRTNRFWIFEPATRSANPPPDEWPSNVSGAAGLALRIFPTRS